MPTYTFINNETDEEFSSFKSISELEIFLKDNPHITQTIRNTPGIVDPIRTGRQKPDDNFRDLLKTIKKGSDNQCTIDTF